MDTEKEEEGRMTTHPESFFTQQRHSSSSPHAPPSPTIHGIMYCMRWHICDYKLIVSHNQPCNETCTPSADTFKSIILHHPEV